MEKLSLNRYETWLAGQPADRVFNDSRLTRAHKNIHRGLQQGRIVDGMAAVARLPDGSFSDETKKGLNEALDKRKAFISSNRAPLQAQGGIAVNSPFSTKKQGTKSLTNDKLANPKNKPKNLTGSLNKKLSNSGIEPGKIPRDPNKYLIKARTFMRLHPTATKAIGATAGVLGATGIGALGYGIYKDIKGDNRKDLETK